MNQIKIVVPDGSMQEVIIELFAKAGLPIVVSKSRTKEGSVAVDWIASILFQRPQEIPQYLKNNHFDLGIVGEDWIADWGYEFPILLTLPVGRQSNEPVRIVLAVDQESDLQKAEDLPSNCEVATEYVRLTERFFSEMGRSDIIVVPSFGNTEHKIKFGATAIVDVTETGNSLKENNLKIIAEIMKSHTAVVANPKSLADKPKRQYIDCLVRLLDGAFQASKHISLTANVPKDALEKAACIIGGLKGASCSPLVGTEDWFALHSVIPQEDEHAVIFDLLQIGVTDIIVNRDIPLIMS